MHLVNGGNCFKLYGFMLFLLLFMHKSSFAVTVTDLIEPIKKLKAEIFGGWMPVKICAAASGIVLSMINGSLVVSGIGVGLAMGIHFFLLYNNHPHHIQ